MKMGQDLSELRMIKTMWCKPIKW